MGSEPKKIGRYKVQGVLGRGAMGTVYLAQDPKLMRPVAIKVVRDPQGDSTQIMMRFQREAVISAKLNHPHIITIFDVGEDPVQGPFMAMEYVDGAALTDLVREKLPLETGLRLLAQTMSALMASEAEGISHRDVKPDNILVSKDWRVKLMDFGIARGNEARLTQAGMVFGTPFYTAPEVLVGGEASSVTDRYSFAVTAFEVISGVLPFHGSSVGTVVYRIVNEPPEMPDSFNPALRTVFELALAKDPAARFPDLFTFMDALLEAVDLSDEPRSRLQHYVSDLRTLATAPPMEITQNLDPEKPPHSRTTEVPGTPVLSRFSEEDPFEGPSYQTVMIPVLQPEAPPSTAEPVPEELAPEDVAEEEWMDSSHILPPEQFLYKAAPVLPSFKETRAILRLEPEPPQIKQAPIPEETEPVTLVLDSAPGMAESAPLKAKPELLEGESAVMEAESVPMNTEPVIAESAAAETKPAVVATEPVPPEANSVLVKAELVPSESIPELPREQGEPDFTGGDISPDVTEPKIAPLARPTSKSPKQSSFRMWAAGFLIIGILGASAYFLLHRGALAISKSRSRDFVSITTSPAGATIYLDGQQAGKTPVHRMQLDGAKHSLRIELAGYQAANQDIRPGMDQLHFALKPAGHPIAVKSEPSGADVFLNDQSVGTTPIPALLIPFEGRRELILKRTGYKDWYAVVDPDLPFPEPILLSPAGRGPRP